MRVGRGEELDVGGRSGALIVRKVAALACQPNLDTAKKTNGWLT